MYHLGMCYENGHGHDKDITKAIHWYEKAASWGETKACERLVNLVANPAVMDDMFEHGYVAPAA